MEILWYEWLVTAGVGAIIGIAEIFSRYRDEPDDALLTLPAMGYLAVNASASVAALVVIRLLNWTFGIVAEQSIIAWAQVFIAGFSAMAVLRTTIWKVRVNDEDVAVGPSRFLDAVLNTVDRAVDRKRAAQRAVSISNIMKDVDFEKAYQSLPMYCFGLLQNLPSDEQEKVLKRVLVLRSLDVTERVKALLLGLTLMNLVGEQVLATAVRDLGDDIRRQAAPQPHPAN